MHWAGRVGEPWSDEKNPTRRTGRVPNQRAEGRGSRVINRPGVSGAVPVLALKVQCPRKPLSPRESGTGGHPRDSIFS